MQLCYYIQTQREEMWEIEMAKGNMVEIRNDVEKSEMVKTIWPKFLLVVLIFFFFFF